ncbi:MAG: lysylphosphatidylglycerol synthase transmembrane domain-containing protein, partial [Flavobacteriales bacterium]
MRKALISGLRMAIPIALGIWLVLYFYRQLDEQQREELFTAFREANWWWLGLSVVFGIGSHMSRAWRWRYLLSPLGHNVGFLNAFNAVMSGYFMNMLIQRAGEVSRAVMLDRAEKVPFEKGFGTIIGERAVDMVMLLGIAGLTVLLQLDKLDLFQQRIAAFRAEQGDPTEASTGWPWWLIAGICVAALAAIVGVYLLITRPALQARLKKTIRGFYEGAMVVFRTPHKWAFLFHTFLIWVLYIAMFWVGFMALPGTQEVPFAGVMAGFIAGSVGIVLVQGGIGVYPAFVALIVSVYMVA